MFSGTVRTLRRNLLSIIVLALVCLAISGFVPQNTPELRSSRRKAASKQELDQFMGAKSSKADMSGAQQLVDGAIQEHKVVVFSKSYCPFCAKAKQALTSIIPASAITIYELDQRDDGAAIQQYLQSKTGQRTVPQVFINGKFIGGGDDTARLAQNGELEKMLKAAGVL